MPPFAAAPARVEKASVADHRDAFIALVEAAESKAAEAAAARSGSAAEEADVIESKQTNAANGLETSTFTVCTRVRPVSAAERAAGGDSFNCVITCAPKTAANGDRTEAAVVLAPAVSLRGEPKLERSSFPFDHAFGPDSTDDGIFARVGLPLVARAKAGEVGCIFAYGQTGSGKTHTIGNLLERVASEVFAGEGEAPRPVTFSYLELLGQSTINDCLAGGAAGGGVAIGELLDGRVEARGLSIHAAKDAASLGALVALAKARRTTASTERNAQSSRSHGIAILTVGAPGERTPGAFGPKPGVLLVIDLAGSERAADTKAHCKERLEETKAVNLSLMALKDCIRARTVSGAPAAGERPFVPYRRSKLTLLMKDVFDIGCSRLCSTVVLSCVSPLAGDAKHTANTLAYAAPLRVAMRGAAATPLEVDTRDPATWSHARAAEWLSAAAVATGIAGAGGLDAAALLKGGISGLELCRLPEAEIHLRVKMQGCVAAAGASQTLGAKLHAELWTLICDAKTRKRKPNGNLVTDAEEAAEAAAAEAATVAKSDLWKERERSMAAGTTLEAAAEMATRMALEG